MPAERKYIGGGGFGRVFKGEWRGKIVALKVLYKPDNQVLQQTFCREALMWGSLEHEFVLQFIGIYVIEDEMAPQFFLVSPYMKNGTLAQWRKRRNPSTTEIEERMLEVAQGIKYIHSEGAVHGDIRGENVLLDDNLHVQIGDFGLSRLSEATNTQSGTKHANFSAPELFGCFEDADDPSAEYPTRTQMSDVYAFGCLYYEIHFDSIPFSAKPEFQIMTLVTRGTRPPRIEEPFLSDVAWKMIQRCWVQEPSQRPRMKDVTESMDMSESASLSSLNYEIRRDTSPTLSFTTTVCIPSS
ncbi:kinase-like domain-containing protein [Amanita rubescens]|nr:kinase-like domain-containing protein [Amanita rubescens]